MLVFMMFFGLVLGVTVITPNEIKTNSIYSYDDEYLTIWNKTNLTQDVYSLDVEKDLNVSGNIYSNGILFGSGSGDVVGPLSATNNAIALFDGATGKLIKNSQFIIRESGVGGTVIEFQEGRVGLGDSTTSLSNTEMSNEIVIGAGASATKLNGIVIGQNALSSGNIASLAVGGGARSTANYAISFGTNANATGLSAISIGYNSDATATNAIALGDYALARGSNSIAIGKSVSTNGVESIAIGVSSSATSSDGYSIAIGSAIVSGRDSIGMGTDTEVSGSFGIVLGNFAGATGNNTVVIGFSSHANAENAIALGANTVNEVANSFKVGSASVTHTFLDTTLTVSGDTLFNDEIEVVNDANFNQNIYVQGNVSSGNGHTGTCTSNIIVLNGIITGCTS
jgi:hypothetical protein